jgi:hypothetical protein
VGRKLERVPASALRAISGLETSDRLGENSGLFAFAFPLIELDSTTFRMFASLSLSESSKAGNRYFLPSSIRLFISLKSW